jgi:predicted methyltransferase
MGMIGSQQTQPQIVLSPSSVRPLLEGRSRGESTVETSLDLGLTRSVVCLRPEDVMLPDGQKLSWEKIESVASEHPVCWLVRGNDCEKIQFYSEEFDRFYSLMPTERAPTMLVSGIPMHRIKGIDPHEDTLRKIRSVAPVTGRVLDTTTGLGYTAIEASRTASEVVTIELDPTALEVAKRNPWSLELFIRPNIRQLIGDAAEQIEGLDSARFARIFHDPPTFRLAGELYSGAFYRQLYRVLQSGGRLFHYIGDLESRTGSVVAKGSVRRLQEAGFSRVDRRPETFGLVAWK